MEKNLFNNEALDDILYRLSNSTFSDFFYEKIGERNMLTGALNSDYSGVASTTLSGCSFQLQQLTLFKRLLNEGELILEFILENADEFRNWFNNNPYAYFKHCSIFKNSTLSKDYYKDFKSSYYQLTLKYNLNLLNFISSLLFLSSYNCCIKKKTPSSETFTKAIVENFLDKIYEKSDDIKNYLEKLDLKPLEFKDEVRNLLGLIASEALYFEDIPLRLLDYASTSDVLTVIILIVNVKEYIAESKVIPFKLSKYSFMSIDEYKDFMSSISESYLRIYDYDEEVRRKIEEDLKL
ncbi:hypothetical protein [Clostridium sp. LIBA-8841]|uniref:hypothetical protein n=1 Tax=Clostridium sp. LIBA-8841 TaxID=2987530 RepID=UPI002AC3D4AB|nr:hypothetical protein [Clostridium sp. LIBA-8841]MDZ5253469.1 hypothetical protein [Clostridium sp. LIBA-8841]